MRRDRLMLPLCGLFLLGLGAVLLSGCTGVVTNIQRNVQCDADATAVGRRTCVIIQTPPAGESHDH